MSEFPGEERYRIVKELYLLFGKQVKDDMISVTIRKTQNIHIADFLKACKSIEELETFPQNLSAKIWSLAKGAAMSREQSEHSEYKKTTPFDCAIEHSPEANGRYLKLLSKTLNMKLSREMFTSFWNFINQAWGMCRSDRDYLYCITMAEQKSNDLVSDDRKSLQAV